MLMTQTMRTRAKLCRNAFVLGAALSWLALGGCDASTEDGGGPPEKGCTSSNGFGGIVVPSRSGCYKDHAFCEERPDGTYCTGGDPSFMCPEGQVLIGWRRCVPDGLGGAGGEDGAGGEGGGG